MRFGTMVEDVWKKMLSVDLTDVMKAVALQAVKQTVKARTSSVVPWLVGGAAIGFGAGMLFGPKLVQRGKSLTAAAGEALTRIGGEVSDLAAGADGASDGGASEPDERNGARTKKRVAPTAKA